MRRTCSLRLLFRRDASHPRFRVIYARVRQGFRLDESIAGLERRIPRLRQRHHRRPRPRTGFCQNTRRKLLLANYSNVSGGYALDTLRPRGSSYLYTINSFVAIINKNGGSGNGNRRFQSVCVLLFTSFQELHPTARGQGGSSCCSATGRCPWRLRRVRQPRRDTASGRWRSGPRP